MLSEWILEGRRKSSSVGYYLGARQWLPYPMLQMGYEGCHCKEMAPVRDRVTLLDRTNAPNCLSLWTL